MSLEFEDATIEEKLLEGDLLTKITAKEELLAGLKNQVAQLEIELSLLKKKNAETTTIRWKDSVLWCLEVDKDNPRFFVKTNAYVAKCIAVKHGVEITTEITNKISSTLSFLFNNKELGRFTHNGKSYYGLPEFFSGSSGKLDCLSSNYEKWLVWLKQ